MTMVVFLYQGWSARITPKSSPSSRMGSGSVTLVTVPLTPEAFKANVRVDGVLFSLIRFAVVASQEEPQIAFAVNEVATTVAERRRLTVVVVIPSSSCLCKNCGHLYRILHNPTINSTADHERLHYSTSNGYITLNPE